MWLCLFICHSKTILYLGKGPKSVSDSSLVSVLITLCVALRLPSMKARRHFPNFWFHIKLYGTDNGSVVPRDSVALVEASFSAFILLFFFSLSGWCERDGTSRVWSSGERARPSPQVLGLRRAQVRQHNRSNRDGGSTNNQCTHRMLGSVLLESCHRWHASASPSLL